MSSAEQHTQESAKDWLQDSPLKARSFSGAFRFVSFRVTQQRVVDELDALFITLLTHAGGFPFANRIGIGGRHAVDTNRDNDIVYELLL